MKKPHPEILAPAGQFASAVHAFEAGADAVYLGLKDFSARSAAKNFLPEEILRLRSAAGERKIYLALNTLIRGVRVNRILEQIPSIMDLPVDAYILQDWGLFFFLREHFPDKVFHASTQMAVHNLGGARFLSQQGFSRVVLSRELHAEEIRKIKETLPDLELEVFVHGAHCTGFSGLCLASGKVLGRSANQGQCAQICRTWFQKEDGSKGFYLSARDNMAIDTYQELARIGVDSFKIEGRMKGPEYTKTAVALYKSLLSGEKQQAKLEEKKLKTIFSREIRGDRQTTEDYPGTRGERAARVVGRVPGGYLIDSWVDLKPRDGLLYLEESSSPPTPKKFAYRSDKKGRLLTEIVLNIGAVLYRISRSDQKLPEIKAKKYPKAKIPIDLDIEYKQGKLYIHGNKQSFVRPLESQPSPSPNGARDALISQLRKSHESPFLPREIVIEGTDGLFFPPSQIKRIRREFYQWLEDQSPTKTAQVLGEGGFDSASASNWTGEAWSSLENNIKDSQGDQTLIPNQPKEEDLLRIRSRILDPISGLPFIMSFHGLEFSSLPEVGVHKAMALAPVVFQEALYREELEAFLDSQPGPFLVGLGNPWHLDWALGQKHPGLLFFIDYGLYGLNSWSRSGFARILGEKLTFVLPDVELSSQGQKQLFHPPLMISRICQKKEAHKGRCPSKCSGDWEEYWNQGSKKYRVLSHSCLNFLLEN